MKTFGHCPKENYCMNRHSLSECTAGRTENFNFSKKQSPALKSTKPAKLSASIKAL